MIIDPQIGRDFFILTFTACNAYHDIKQSSNPPLPCSSGCQPRIFQIPKPGLLGVKYPTTLSDSTTEICNLYGNKIRGTNFMQGPIT